MEIYFCGSMTGSREKQENYEIIIDYLNTYGHVINDFVKDKVVIDYEPEIVFKRDSSNLNKTDILIADISVTSTGVGFELGYIYHLNKPVLVVYDENMSAPSTLPRGADKFIVRSYKTIEDEKKIIDEFINNIPKK